MAVDDAALGDAEPEIAVQFGVATGDQKITSHPIDFDAGVQFWIVGANTTYGWQQ